jgi:hypothetical protein
MTPTHGLGPANQRIGGACLRDLATVAIDESDAPYRASTIIVSSTPWRSRRDGVIGTVRECVGGFS